MQKNIFLLFFTNDDDNNALFHIHINRKYGTGLNKIIVWKLPLSSHATEYWLQDSWNTLGSGVEKNQNVGIAKG